MRHSILWELQMTTPSRAAPRLLRSAPWQLDVIQCDISTGIGTPFSTEWLAPPKISSESREWP